MYSAVLMLALTAGNEAVDFGHRCHGCTTTCSVPTYSCPPVCTTYKVCSAPVYSCSTACHSSCHGGLFARLRERRCHCTTSCTVVYTTCSSPCTGIVPPPVILDKKKEMPKSEKIDGPKKDKVSVDVPATIIVSLPADARLTVDGATTSSTSDRRTLVTPVLEGGAAYVYTMQAEITREGRVLTQTQQVTVRGGETSTVRFNFSTQSVASR